MKPDVRFVVKMDEAVYWLERNGIAVPDFIKRRTSESHVKRNDVSVSNVGVAPWMAFKGLKLVCYESMLKAVDKYGDRITGEAFLNIVLSDERVVVIEGKDRVEYFDPDDGFKDGETRASFKTIKENWKSYFEKIVRGNPR